MSDAPITPIRISTGQPEPEHSGLCSRLANWLFPQDADCPTPANTETFEGWVGARFEVRLKWSTLLGLIISRRAAVSAKILTENDPGDAGGGYVVLHALPPGKADPAQSQ